MMKNKKELIDGKSYLDIKKIINKINDSDEMVRSKFTEIKKRQSESLKRASEFIANV